MSYKDKQLLFYFDQYFRIRLGEGVYQYRQKEDTLSILRAFVSLCIAWLSRIRMRDSDTIRFSHRYKHLFYIETINQRNAVSNILEQMNPNDLILLLNNEVNGVNLDFSGKLDHVHWPTSRIYKGAIGYLPKAIWLSFAVRSKYRKKVARHHVIINLALFLMAVRFLKGWLQNLKPVSVTVVNDHNLIPLALLLASRRTGISSIYIQHASVSDVFPKLLSTVALLEGEHAWETYNRIGNYSKEIRLVGIPRMDGYIGYHGNEVIPHSFTVGVCLKVFYTKSQINELLMGIRSSARVKRIILRPHPGSPKEFWEQLNEDHHFDISDSRIENAMSFLASVDVLVSGESTIVLEAALMKMPSIHFDDGSFFFPFDMYGLVKNNVAYCSVRNPMDITAVLNDLRKERVLENFSKCKYYCSTVQTEDESHSSQLLLNYYRQFPC